MSITAMKFVKYSEFAELESITEEAIGNAVAKFLQQRWR